MDPIRQQVLAILDGWERGDLGPLAVVEEAELIEQSLPEGKWEQDDFQVEAELLAMLSTAPATGLLASDVPAVRRLLLSGGTSDDWTQWQTYWDADDVDARRQRLRDDPIYAPFL